MLNGPEGNGRAAADRLLQHTVGARLSAGMGGGPPIPATRRLLWATVANALTDALRVGTAAPVANLLRELCVEPSDLADDERSIAGCAARALLTWTLEQDGSYQYLVRAAVEAVAKTFASDPPAAAGLLRRLITAERLKEYGFLEMPVLGNAVTHLIDDDPGLVRDIYIQVFGYDEESADTTVMREGVLTLTSSRGADYNTARYSLCQAYRTFADSAPAAALDALAAVTLRRGIQDGVGTEARDPVAVAWGPDLVEIQPDGIYWDSNGSDSSDERALLGTFEESLAELTAQQAKEQIALVRGAPRPASIWRRVLRVATAHPTIYGRIVGPLLTAPEALAMPELCAAAGTFLAAGFGQLPKATRRAVELAILSLPAFVAAAEEDADRGREVGARTRDRLLMQLDSEAIIGGEARQLAADARATWSGATSDPGPTWSRYADEDPLAPQGVDVDPVGDRVRELVAPVKAFGDAHLNGGPSVAETHEITDPLRALRGALRTAGDDGVETALTNAGWHELRNAAEIIARNRELDPTSSTVATVRDILLTAASRSDPEPPDDPTALDASRHFSNASRVTAAKGLPQLARVSGLQGASEVLEAIEVLATDPHPTVRYQIAGRLNALRETAPELRRRIASQMLTTDSSAAVVGALLEWSLVALTEPPGDYASTATALRTGFDRFPAATPGADRLHEVVVMHLAGMYMGQGIAEAKCFLDEVVIAKLKDEPQHAQHVIGGVREELTLGEVEPGDASQQQVRQRALALAGEIFRAATGAMQQWTTELQGLRPKPDDPRLMSARAVASIIHSIASEVYFATGAFDENQNRPVSTTRGQRERLYREAGALIDLLCEATFPSTTHYVLQSLESFISFDARGVFLRIAKSVKAGTAGSYQADSLAVKLVVQLIERYLAEYPALLQQDDDCRTALIEVLDIFIAAGWPEAMRLTYRLHDIYR